MANQTDYDKLASAHGALDLNSTQGPAQAPVQGVDYDSLAKVHGVLPEDQTAVTSSSSQPKTQPEGFIHSALTAAGVSPEAIEHPVTATKQFLAGTKDEVEHPVDTTEQVGRGTLGAITNPSAQSTAISRMKAPGWKNKLLGGEEYLESGIPVIGSNLVKASEQSAVGNQLGMAGTLAGTAAPLALGEGRIPDEAPELGEQVPSRMASRLRTDRGQGPLKPGVEKAARIIGAAPGIVETLHGNLLWGPVEAGYGMLRGPKMLDIVTPRNVWPTESIDAEAASKPGEAGTLGKISPPSESGVAHIPEPRPLMKGEKPGLMNSVPREQLADLAKSGKPGAGAQLSQLGAKQIYIPRGAEIEAPDMAKMRSENFGSGKELATEVKRTLNAPEADATASATKAHQQGVRRQMLRQAKRHQAP